MGSRDVRFVDLQTQIRQLTDTENDPNISATELKAWINEARAEVFDVLRRADPDTYEETQTIITSGNRQTYLLPDDWFDTKAVEWLSTSTYYIPLRKITLRERLDFQVPGSATASNASAYRIVGSNVELWPRPPNGQTYRHLYTPAATVLTSDNDTVDGREANLVRWKAAIPVVLKQDKDPGPYERGFERELARVQAQTDARVPSEPTVIADVEDYSDGATWLRRIPRMRY